MNVVAKLLAKWRGAVAPEPVLETTQSLIKKAMVSRAPIRVRRSDGSVSEGRLVEWNLLRTVRVCVGRTYIGAVEADAYKIVQLDEFLELNPTFACSPEVQS